MSSPDTLQRVPSRSLDRFTTAQDPVMPQVRSELAAGAKRSHWMWFVFPQLRGLGRSAAAQYYGLADLDEARAYLRHDTLGSRLVACTDLVNAIEDRSVSRIFGSPDDLKFRSCMTLFAQIEYAPDCFKTALDRYHDGAPDGATMAMLLR